MAADGTQTSGMAIAAMVMGICGLVVCPLILSVPAIVFGGAGLPLPETFALYPPRAVHGWIAKALLLVIAFHLIGALYHQFIRKDRLLSRMWFGRKDAL